MTDITYEDGAAAGAAAGRSRWRRWGAAFWKPAAPVLYGLIAGGVLLLLMGKNPFTFYWTIIDEGFLTWSGLQQTIVRCAPLFLMSAGFIVAFQAGLWNIGGDGQFLMAAAVVAGVGAQMMGIMPFWVALILLCIIGFAVGGAWTIVPGLLKAYYGMNEIITTLMMSYLGINLANYLIKNPFLTDTGWVPQTNIIPFAKLLPYIPGTTIHVGIIIALIVLAIIYYMQNWTAYGLRLRILGINPSAAKHAGINVKRDIISALALSGALIGLAAAVEILGVWGYMRADWNPAFGMTLFAIVFLAGLNVMTVIPLVFVFAVIQTGGHQAALEAGLPNDFLLLLVGLILFFMVLTQWTRTKTFWQMKFHRRASGVNPDLGEAVRNG